MLSLSGLWFQHEFWGDVSPQSIASSETHLVDRDLRDNINSVQKDQLNVQIEKINTPFTNSHHILFKKRELL